MLRGGQPPEQVSHTHPLMDGPVVSFRPTVASLPTYSCTTRSSLLAPDLLNAIHAYCTRPQDLGATSDGMVFYPDIACVFGYSFASANCSIISHFCGEKGTLYMGQNQTSCFGPV